MVNTINHKYFQINRKTESRNFYQDKWTLINHFLYEKNISKVYRQWIYFDGMTVRNCKADYGQTLKDCNILQIKQLLKIQRTKITVNSAEQKLQ